MGVVSYAGKRYEAASVDVYNSNIDLRDEKGVLVNQIRLGGDIRSRFRVSGNIDCARLVVGNNLFFKGNVDSCEVGNVLVCVGSVNELVSKVNIVNKTYKDHLNDIQLGKNTEKLYHKKRPVGIKLDGRFQYINIPIFVPSQSREFIVELEGRVSNMKVYNCMELSKGSIKRAIVESLCVMVGENNKEV